MDRFKTQCSQYLSSQTDEVSSSVVRGMVESTVIVSTGSGVAVTRKEMMVPDLPDIVEPTSIEEFTTGTCPTSSHPLPPSFLGGFDVRQIPKGYMHMTQKDCIHMVSESIKTILMHTCSDEFREECFQLLKVSSSEDAGNQFQQLFKQLCGCGDEDLVSEAEVEVLQNVPTDGPFNIFASNAEIGEQYAIPPTPTPPGSPSPSEVFPMYSQQTSPPSVLESQSQTSLSQGPLPEIGNSHTNSQFSYGTSQEIGKQSVIPPSRTPGSPSRSEAFPTYSQQTSPSLLEYQSQTGLSQAPLQEIGNSQTNSQFSYGTSQGIEKQSAIPPTQTPVSPSRSEVFPTYSQQIAPFLKIHKEALKHGVKSQKGIFSRQNSSQDLGSQSQTRLSQGQGPLQEIGNSQTNSQFSSYGSSQGISTPSKNLKDKYKSLTRDELLKHLQFLEK